MAFADYAAELNDVVIVLLLALGFVYLLCGIDDVFIDLVALFARLAPRKLSAGEMEAMDALAEKKFAVIVPAWKESGIIRRMLLGNLKSVEYRNYHFFVGVYPNDPATGKEVRDVGLLYPNVHAVENSRPGPTSKGQILNHMVREIFEHEEGLGRFDGFLMQDAEDLMHPKVLKLVNAEMESGDFIQIPVFSLSVNMTELIAGTYVDEFAESHTKDLLVREKLGAAVPSAGVGTGLSRNLVLRLMRLNDGSLFGDKALTEDYELGVQAHDLGLKPRFAACWFTHPVTGRREYIATREYFPKRLLRSIRQKTRWTVGISYQGWANLGWPGSFPNRYFLHRDRRGILTNILTVLGYLCVAVTAGYAEWLDPMPLRDVFTHPLARLLFFLNVILMVNRLVQRARCVTLVYGAAAAVPILVRWPLANFINAAAAVHALRKAFHARVTRAALAWGKTEHELPPHFGQPEKEVKERLVT